MEEIKMNIGGREYPVSGYVESDSLGMVPVVSLAMMSNYSWQLRCLKSRLEHPEAYRAIGEDIDVTISRLRGWLEEHKPDPIQQQNIAGA